MYLIEPCFEPDPFNEYSLFSNFFSFSVCLLCWAASLSAAVFARRRRRARALRRRAVWRQGRDGHVLRLGRDPDADGLRAGL